MTDPTDPRLAVSPEHPCCLPFLAGEPPPMVNQKSPPSSARWRGLGFSALALAVGVVFVFNSRTLWATQAKVRADQRAAIEAAKPAELEVTLIPAADCPRCFDPARLTKALETNSRLKITNEQSVAADSPAGQTIIKDLAVTQLPAIVLQGQIEKTLAAARFLKSYGQTAPDGRFVVSSLPAPYVEIKSGKVRGLFEAIYVTDETCGECYDPLRHRSALAGSGLTPDKETTVDRGDAAGKELIKQYGIESVPTLLLKGDLGVYQGFQSVWPSVGTVEADGTYVFRAGQAQMGAYYDLKAKKLVKPETKQPEPAPAK